MKQRYTAVSKRMLFAFTDSVGWLLAERNIGYRYGKLFVMRTRGSEET